MTFCLLMLSLTVVAQHRIVLENARMKAVFDRRNGALVQLADKQTGWKLVEREKLGQSFQMLVPVEGAAVPFAQEMRFNNIEGVEQSAPEVECTRDSVTFVWRTLYSPANKKRLNIAFAATAVLTDEGLVFSGEVTNNSDYTVEYVAWPYLGEVALPDKVSEFVLDTKNYVKSLYPRFPSDHGYWGVDYPTTMAYLPSDSYILLRNDRQGALIRSVKSVEEFVIGSFELIPGHEAAYCNPKEDVMDGQPVRIAFKANRVLYAPKGSVRVLSPLTLSFYRGSWYKGVEQVRNTPKPAEAWLAASRTWQRVSAATPSVLLDRARDAKANGVQVLSVSNWCRAGRDRLGEVHVNYDQAIAACRKMGLKMLLECDFLRVDSRTDQYRNELQRLIVSDPYGFFYNQYIMCPLSDTTQTLVARAYDQTFGWLHADGVVCTDVPFRIKTLFCHDPRHGHSASAYTAPAMVRLDAEFAARARAARVEFKTGGSYLYDIQSADLDFMVLPQIERRSVLRYLNPGLPIVAPIDVRTARSDINTCVKNQYLICYGPLFRTDSLSAYPHVVEYAERVERFRARYEDEVWRSEMIDASEASVEGLSTYTVYKSRQTGKRVAVLVNDSSMDKDVTVTFPGAVTSVVEIASPEVPESEAVSGTFRVPMLSLVVAMEK